MFSSRMLRPPAYSWPPKRSSRSADRQHRLHHMETADAPAGPLALPLFETDDDGGTVKPLDDARGYDAEDAGMPALVAYHDGPTLVQPPLRDLRQGFIEYTGLGLAPFPVVAVQLPGDLVGDLPRSGGEHLHDLDRGVHAPGRH